MWTCNDPILWVSPVLLPHFWDIILFFPFHQRISWKRTMVDEFVLKAGKHYTWMICNQNLFAHARLSVQLQVPRNPPHWNIVLFSPQIGGFRNIYPVSLQFTVQYMLEKTSWFPWCWKLLFLLSLLHFFSNAIVYQRFTLAPNCVFLPIISFRNIKVLTLPWEAI